ncbi:Uncharacterised protein [Mycobacteroides abscessus subsp. abscessus]|nr:Uncharacterised protein [Mycobacteroides abscessus subsp. abscessus]
MDSHEVTPSATLPPAALRASCSVSPLPNRIPKVRFRECAEVQVATRSPTPASPARVV